ncbi:undecaprenyl/decaprenyl-phosphate alpha-N-acetylglucosaminyl 1-phosphate transferase [bacterium]|nr:undecaprenyl/decaprenyl-phosphate alpha-N-acetylglucosaminyl 1-phosphate transferase [bacterium]
MTTMIFVFLASLGLALFLTPIVRAQATKRGIIDHPGERRVHKAPIARAGGVAVFAAFLIPFVGAVVAQDFLGITNAEFDTRTVCFVLGATLCFALGLWDDVRGLSPKTKVSIQAIAAGIAYLGGVQITQVAIPGFGLTQLGILSAPVTIFWFLLLVNAINLIDGLDGLATGIIFFASIILLGVHSPASSFSVAIGFAALAGATLGFLKYNFNPASIFLGDSGAYFLGFTFAGLSTLGALKTPATVGLLIPLIAAGVPLFDVLWSPIRRFILGRNLFGADKDHIHHRLLSLGYTQKRAVLMLYSFTITLGLIGLFILHGSNERATFGIVVAGATIVFAVQKLGYLNFAKGIKLRRWIESVSDQVGVAHERREFFAREIAIRESEDLPSLLLHIQQACDATRLKSITLQLHLDPEGERCFCYPEESSTPEPDPADVTVSMALSPIDPSQGRLQVSIGGKDHNQRPYLLNRADQLRRSISEGLERIRNLRDVTGVGQTNISATFRNEFSTDGDTINPSPVQLESGPRRLEH